jgi:hypothetical protein
MDVLTFVSNIVVALVWPLFLTGLLIGFRKQIMGLLSSISRVKYGDAEIEMFGFTTDRDVDILLSALQNGPHSFEWLRKNQLMKLTNDEFNTLIDNNLTLFAKTKMVKSGSTFDESLVLDGVKLTEYASSLVSETECFGSGSGSGFGSGSSDSGSGSGSGQPFGSGSYSPRDY